MIRPFCRRPKLFLAACLLLLAACSGEDLTKPPERFGDFQLGYTIIVTSKMQKVGPSREATGEDWEALLKSEIAKRTGQYDGNKLYHLGINVDGYALAYPGIPLLVNPKSVLALSVNVWDDTAQRRINAEPKRITVFEPFTGRTIIGSGLTQGRDQQMENLAASAARQINDWLVENRAWFTPEAVAARALLPRQGGASAAVPAASAQATAQAAAIAQSPAASTAKATAAAPAATTATTTAATTAETSPATTTAPARTRSTTRTTTSSGSAIPGIDRSIRNSVTTIPQATYP
ncbi:hypothetical protein [Frigidibacter sp. MR17.24]|uniref:hypothetical protein n=1 Tax=Frigidibacter sp. MR17.24 TaxID=3127345 RepID=UPI003013079F